MTNYALSVIRTGVQLAVGAFVAWLLSLGIDVGAEANTGLTIGLTAVVVGVYYMIVRAIEPKLPAFLRAILMGGTITPVYTNQNKAVTDTSRSYESGRYAG